MYFIFGLYVFNVLSLRKIFLDTVQFSKFYCKS